MNRTSPALFERKILADKKLGVWQTQKSTWQNRRLLWITLRRVADGRWI